MQHCLKCCKKLQYSILIPKIVTLAKYKHFFFFFIYSHSICFAYLSRTTPPLSQASTSLALLGLSLVHTLYHSLFRNTPVWIAMGVSLLGVGRGCPNRQRNRDRDMRLRRATKLIISYLAFVF